MLYAPNLHPYKVAYAYVDLWHLSTWFGQPMKCNCAKRTPARLLPRVRQDKPTAMLLAEVLGRSGKTVSTKRLKSQAHQLTKAPETRTHATFATCLDLRSWCCDIGLWARGVALVKRT